MDKVSETSKGEEIQNLLCHLTDFSQNDEFHDKYYSGINFDLSKALFIFSFNDESKVNPILKDRMTVIRTQGFKTNDKIKLVKKYLLKQVMEEIGMDSSQIILDDRQIQYIIEQYSPDEQGVRMLKRCLNVIKSKLNVAYLLQMKRDEFPNLIIEDIVNDIINKVSQEALMKKIKKQENHMKNDNLAIHQILNQEK